jgi:hypothetical protein
MAAAWSATKSPRLGGTGTGTPFRELGCAHESAGMISPPNDRIPAKTNANIAVRDNFMAIPPISFNVFKGICSRTLQGALFSLR